MSTIQYFILCFSIFSGGALAFRYRELLQSHLQLILSFSGAYIVGITALHLIPETFYNANNTLGAWLLAGFFGQLLLDQLSSGVEHGHIHAAHHPSNGFVFKIMLGLCIHSFVEGMPLNSAIPAQLHDHEHNHLFWGIILHEVPASFALVSLLLISGFRQNIVVLCLIAYSSMSALGALTSAWLAPNEAASKIMMAIVIGTFLHIATTILFEADSAHKISWRKLVAIFLGISIAILTLL
jgi:zinc transporter ZupT